MKLKGGKNEINTRQKQLLLRINSSAFRVWRGCHLYLRVDAFNYFFRCNPLEHCASYKNRIIFDYKPIRIFMLFYKIYCLSIFERIYVSSLRSFMRLLNISDYKRRKRQNSCNKTQINISFYYQSVKVWIATIWEADESEKMSFVMIAKKSIYKWRFTLFFHTIMMVQ